MVRAFVLVVSLALLLPAKAADGDFLFTRIVGSDYGKVLLSPNNDDVLAFNGSGSLVAVPRATLAGAHTHTFSSLTSKPTTLSGYGITDAQPLDSDLTSIAALTTTSNGRSLLTASALTAAGLGLTNGAALDTIAGNGSSFYLSRGNHTGTQGWNTIVSTPTTLSGYGITDAQPLDSDLTSIAALTTTSNGRSLLTASSLSAAGLGLTNGAALDTIAGNGSAYYLDLANHTGTLPAASLPAPGTTTLGGVKRNAGTSGQYVTGIDSSGNLTYDTPAGGGGSITIGSTTASSFTNLSGIGTYGGTGLMTLTDSNSTLTPNTRLILKNTHAATADPDGEDATYEEQNVSPLLSWQADYWTGSATATREWGVYLKAETNSSSWYLGPSFLPNLFSLYATGTSASLNLDNATNAFTINIGDLANGGSQLSASYDPGSNVLSLDGGTLKLDTSSNNITFGSSGGLFGYGAGSGGAVTQPTSRTQGVTINYPTGAITTNNASLAAGASAEFTVTNNKVGARDTVQVCLASGNVTTSAAFVTAVAAGEFKITVRNFHASTAETGSLILNFTVLKGSNN